MTKVKEAVVALLKRADVRINGLKKRDIRVIDKRLYRRVLTGGSLALGEAYMDGWWYANHLDVFFAKVLRAKLDRSIRTWKFLRVYLAAKLFNRQRFRKAFHIGKHHYDIGNELYEKMLGKHMQYSCAYWKRAKTLVQAQKAKLDLICRKLQLKPGMTLLDIGCGWGGLLEYAAKKYKITGVGITVSKEQAKVARKRCKNLPVKIFMKDYRELNQEFDRVVSVGMIEHVGPKNYRTYMKVAHRCLKQYGLFLLHTIGGNKSVDTTEPWIDTYIFPGGVIPSAKQLMKATEKLFVLEDWHNFGPHYDKTLMAWHKNFVEAWPKLRKVKDATGNQKYDVRFFRMWTYYLLSCAGSFRARKNQVWQLVLSKGCLPSYESIR